MLSCFLVTPSDPDKGDPDKGGEDNQPSGPLLTSTTTISTATFFYVTGSYTVVVVAVVGSGPSARLRKVLVLVLVSGS